MKLGEILLEDKVDDSLTSFLDKFEVKRVKLPAYHDAKTTKRWAFRSKVGKTLFELEYTPANDSFSGKVEYLVRVEAKGIYKNRGSEKFDSQAKAYEFIKKLDLSSLDHSPPPDEKIMKWIGAELGFGKLKASEFKDIIFVEHSKGIQLKENPNSEKLPQFPWLIFVDGDEQHNESTGVGRINMTLKTFKEWLIKMGAKQGKKPQRPTSSSYYD